MTATDFDTAVDQALLICSEMDWAPACEGRSGCSRVATLALYLACESHCLNLTCQPCRDHDYQALLNSKAHGDYECHKCDGWIDGVTCWEKLVWREVPL